MVKQGHLISPFVLLDYLAGEQIQEVGEQIQQGFSFKASIFLQENVHAWNSQSLGVGVA